jgi:hypothetical protein
MHSHREASLLPGLSFVTLLIWASLCLAWLALVCNTYQ